jgi:UDP-N-acetylglucosamine transferase subunit ALG13
MREKYKTKDDVMAALFMALGIRLLNTQIDKSRRKVYFVFDIDDSRGKALEVLVRNNSPKIKVGAGSIYHSMELVKSWLYLTRLRLDDTSLDDIESQIAAEFPSLADDSSPTTISDIADEIEKLAAEYNQQKEL